MDRKIDIYDPPGDLYFCMVNIGNLLYLGVNGIFISELLEFVEEPSC